MKELFHSVGAVWDQYIWGPITEFSIWDALDILCLSVILYLLYAFLKSRRAWKLTVGLILIFITYIISDIADLRSIHQLMAAIAPYGVVLLAVIFQPEIRDVLEKLGSTPVGLFSRSKDHAELTHTISEVVAAACQIALTESDGALIVIENATKLGDYSGKGKAMDSVVSRELLVNIFINRSPLHDGAVIIRNNRIAAAGSKLMLSDNEDILRGLGTRHRAAVGISEVSDCVVVVVSEERHVISLANNGYIRRDYNSSPEELRNEVTMKRVQNDLRRDISRILGTSDAEKDDKNEKQRKWSKPNIHFTWSLRWDKPSKKDKKQDRMAEAASPETAESGDAV